VKKVEVTIRGFGPDTLTVEMEEGDGFEVCVNGRTIVGIDLEYVDEYEDPNPSTPDGPHVNIGYWPDGEQWQLLASVPIARVPI
jgi:hypothetical protein